MVLACEYIIITNVLPNEWLIDWLSGHEVY